MQTITTFEEVERGNKRISTRTDCSTFSNCESKTLDFIKLCLKASANPICLCSFGKDSLVMLHLILRLKKIPVIYWREPYFQTKFKHAQEVAELWDLEIYDYPPTYTDYLQLGNYFDIYNFYYINGIDYMNLYTGTRDYRPNEKFICAIDLLSRPKISSYQFKWDCIFHGHKQCDPVYITDRIEVPKLTIFGNGLLTMPLKDWTNEFIWEYIKKYNLPYNKERYDKIDETRNNDLFPTCHDCLDYRNGSIICPKNKKGIKNIGKSEKDNIDFRDRLLNITYRRNYANNPKT